MPEVQSGSDEPFVVYRDGSGDWKCDFTRNQYGEPYDWVEGINDKDPLAVTFKGSDFADGSQAYVYDKVLTARLRAEFDNTWSNGVNMDELRALVNFLEDNIGELSSDAAEYITGYYKPLVEMYNMIPGGLIIQHPVENYDEEKAWEAFEFIKDKIDALMDGRAVYPVMPVPAPTNRVIEAVMQPGVFEYGGYHFKPYRQFRKGEVERRLEGDSRPWKIDAAYAMRNMSSDFGLGLSTYDWKKDGTDYSHKGFYTASGNSDADIFMCVENGRLYVPHENELFQYNEPPQKAKAADKKPSLLGKLDDNKQKVERDKAANKDKPATKKRGSTEVTD